MAVQIANISRLLIGGVFGAIAIVLIGGPALNSYVNYLDNRDRVLTTPAGVIEAEREANFRIVCPIYANASTWERWTNAFYWDRAWCEDYIDRL